MEKEIIRLMELVQNQAELVNNLKNNKDNLYVDFINKNSRKVCSTDCLYHDYNTKLIEPMINVLEKDLEENKNKLKMLL